MNEVSAFKSKETVETTSRNRDAHLSLDTPREGLSMSYITLAQQARYGGHTSMQVFRPT